MLADTNLSKASSSEVIQSGGFHSKTLGDMVGDLDTKALLDFLFVWLKMFCLNHQLQPY